MTAGRCEIGKVIALTNPVSGHGAAIRAAQLAIARLHHRGVEVVEIIGDDAQDARYLVSAALEKGADAVMVTGGDGVVSNALQVLAGTDVPLGIVPAGTGNDHAREFGLPTKNPEAAADIIVDGFAETIDLGRIQCGNGRKKCDKWFG
ncbi:MAG: diacylglycerol kinase family protein, partial [Mycobacterium sp.]